MSCDIYYFFPFNNLFQARPRVSIKVGPPKTVNVENTEYDVAIYVVFRQQLDNFMRTRG